MDSAPSAGRAQFVLQNAERYAVPVEINRCFFFNPFSVEVLQKVMARILESWYEDPREIMLFFYYPSDEYISWLMTVDELSFYDEIDCRDLFPGNDERERIMVFQLTWPNGEDMDVKKECINADHTEATSGHGFVC
jgi:hypothetical protein